MTIGIEHRVRWNWLLGLIIFFLGGCGDASVTVVTVSSQREAMEIATALRDGLPGVAPIMPDVSTVQSQRQTAYAIRVPASSADTARRVLLQRELPREAGSGLESLATGGGFIPSKSEEQARMMRAIAGELERSIQTIEGVVAARVHIVLRENDPLAGTSSGQGFQPASASVLVKYLPSAMGTTGSGQTTVSEKADSVNPASSRVIPISLQQIVSDGKAPTTAPTPDAFKRSQALQQFIARAVPGLDEQHVAVLFTPAREIQASVAQEAVPAAVGGGELGNAKYALLGATAVFGIAALLFAYLWLKGRQAS